MPKSRFLAFLIKELLPPTVFFAVSFNLILADYLIHFLSFLVATTSALVVGKSVLRSSGFGVGLTGESGARL